MKRLYRAWLCWKYGLCRFHGTMRPHGGYGEGRWGSCQTCVAENREKNIMRGKSDELARVDAQKRLDQLFRLPRREFE